MSFVIDMETADNTAKPADDLDGQSTPSPRKSTPKQVMEDIEKILNVRKRQHHGESDDEEKSSVGEELVKNLRQKCFNLEIEYENLAKLITDLIDVTSELEKRVLKLEDSSLTKEDFKKKSVEFEKRFHRLEDVRQDTNQIASEGALGSWVDVVGKRTTATNNFEPTPLPEIQTKNMISVLVDQKERERRSKNVIVFGLEISKEGNIDQQNKEDETKMRKILSELRFGENLKFNLSRFRSKNNQSSPPPVLVRFEDEETRERVFYVAKLYRNVNNLKNVFINRDLTEIERNLDRDLRQRMKNKNEDEVNNGQPFRWKIRGYDIKRFRLGDAERANRI